MKNRPNIDLARGFVTPLQWVAPASQRVRHLAPGRRSGFLRTSWIWRAMYPPRSVLVAPVLESCRRDVGPRAGTLRRSTRSLQVTAATWPRCARPLQIMLVSRRNAERVDDVAARGRSRLERVAHLAPVGRSSSSTRPMIIFYFFLNHNAPKHLQSLHSTLQHLIKTMHAIWTLKMPNS